MSAKETTGSAGKKAGGAKGSPGPRADRRGQAGQQPERKPMSFLTILAIALVVLIMFNPELRDQTGRAVGYVLEPVIGFGGEYPLVTIMIAGTLMVLFTTLIRHFTTDWLEMAKFQNEMRAFQKEFSQARKDKNTYKVKALQEQQPEVMQKQQKVQGKMLKTMPATMIIVIPLFAWMFTFLNDLGYQFYSAPWNDKVDMFGTTVFPHWILAYMTLSIPLGLLVQKAMKYLSWRERWKGRHPEVTE